MLQKFLTALSDYYTKHIGSHYKNLPNNISKHVRKNTSPKHNISIADLKNKIKVDYKKHYKINDNDILNNCLKPIAKYIYDHCGFELIIIDAWNQDLFFKAEQQMKATNNYNNNNNNNNVFNFTHESVEESLNIYRENLLNSIITLVCEGTLIGISEIADQLDLNDIDTIYNDIKTLDENMSGLDILNKQLLKMILRLYHSTAVSVELNIEDSDSDNDTNINDSNDDEYSDDDDDSQTYTNDNNSTNDVDIDDINYINQIGIYNESN